MSDCSIPCSTRTRKSSLSGRNSGQDNPQATPPLSNGVPVTSTCLAAPPAADTAYRPEVVATRRVALLLQLPPTRAATSFITISGAPSGTRIFFRLVPSVNTNDRESGDQNPGFVKRPVRTGSAGS